jgi:iron complex outermembrane receptor protein
MTVFVHQHCFRSLIYTLAAVLIIVIDLTPASLAQTTAASSTDNAKSTKDTVLPEVVVFGTTEKKTAPKEGSAESGYQNENNTVGPLGNATVLDTPYSINSTSGELIENREVHTEYDALQTNPTVSNLMVGTGYSSMTRVMVRGFAAADAGNLRDGLVDRSFTNNPLENVEKIEVLNGPSSFLYGFVDVGGTVNYISKQPTEKPYFALSYGLYDGAVNFIHADVGGPIPGTNRKLLTRINGYREQGNTFIDGGSQWRTLLSETTTWKLRTDTELKSDTYFQDLSLHGLTTYFNAPSNDWIDNNLNVPSASLYDVTKQYGQYYSLNRTRKTLVGLALNSKLTKSLSMRSAYRYGKMWRDYNFIDAVLVDNAGNYIEKYDDTLRQDEETHADYLLFDGSAHTGQVHHDITFGMTNYYYRYTRGVDNWVVLGKSNITSPVRYAQPSVNVGSNSQLDNEPNRNVVLGDRIQAGLHILGLVGVNYSSMQDKEWAASGGNSYSGQHAFTPTLALTYKPTSNTSIYISYIEALQEGGTAPDTAANANKILPPSVSSQYEIGSKAELSKTQLTLALFRINAVNQYTDPRDNVYKQDGLEVHQGIELTDTGKITNRLTATGGLSLMRARVERARSNTSIENKIPVNIPEQQVRAYFEYRLPGIETLTPSFDINYSGRRPVDSTDVHFFDGATTFDTGLRYEPKLAGHKLSLNINVTNVGNKHYWSYYRSGDGLQLGEPRIVAFSLKGQW